mmetsp:Transcript_102314/g.259869  ORF Transcript_102314/g.259869 Transcript_102314/m.259869 type:complete len:226 (+) Transcript_102314:227-904(+)
MIFFGFRAWLWSAAKQTAIGIELSNCRPWKYFASLGMPSTALATSTAWPSDLELALCGCATRTEATSSDKPLLSRSFSRLPTPQSMRGRPRRCRAVRHSRFASRSSQRSEDMFRPLSTSGRRAEGEAGIARGSTAIDLGSKASTSCVSAAGGLSSSNSKKAAKQIGVFGDAGADAAASPHSESVELCTEAVESSSSSGSSSEGMVPRSLTVERSPSVLAERAAAS